jgi:hypothetical protein
VHMQIHFVVSCALLVHVFNGYVASLSETDTTNTRPF